MLKHYYKPSRKRDYRKKGDFVTNIYDNQGLPLSCSLYRDVAVARFPLGKEGKLL